MGINPLNIILGILLVIKSGSNSNGCGYISSSNKLGGLSLTDQALFTNKVTKARTIASVVVIGQLAWAIFYGELWGKIRQIRFDYLKSDEIYTPLTIILGLIPFIVSNFIISWVLIKKFWNLSNKKRTLVVYPIIMITITTLLFHLIYLESIKDSWIGS